MGLGVGVDVSAVAAAGRGCPQPTSPIHRPVAPLARPVTLAAIKARPELAEMALVRVGRLSVTPVTPVEWETIVAMGS